MLMLNLWFTIIDWHKYIDFSFHPKKNFHDQTNPSTIDIFENFYNFLTKANNFISVYISYYMITDF